MSAQFRYRRAQSFDRSGSRSLRDDPSTAFSTLPNRDVFDLNMSWRLAGSTLGLGYQLQSSAGGVWGGRPATEAAGLSRFLPGSEQATHSLMFGLTREWGADEPPPLVVDPPPLVPTSTWRQRRRRRPRRRSRVGRACRGDRRPGRARGAAAPTPPERERDEPADRSGHLPVQRGHPLRIYEKLGAHPMQVDGQAGHALRRLGTERALRLGDRRLQRLAAGRQPAHAARQLGDLGGLRRRRGLGNRLQVPHRLALRTRSGSTRPTPTRSRPSCRRAPARSSPGRQHDWQDADWMDERADAARDSTRRWRSTRCISARGSALRRIPAACSPTARSRPRLAEYAREHGVHPRRAPAGDGAPVLRLVGLPDDVVLRPDQPLRHARGLHVLRRRPAPARHRRHPRLGARRTSPATSTASPTSTARISTSTPIPARASIPTGAA